MKPKTQDIREFKQVPVRMRPADWKVLAHLAIDLDTSVQELIIRGINHVLKENGKAPIKFER